MITGSGRADELLAALERQLRAAGSGRLALVVCGGTALAALGLVSRTTRDVDVLALADSTGSRPVLVPIESLPGSVADAAGVVARDFGLAADWLNAGPARQVRMGLPEGIEERLVRRDYGPALTVYFTGRLDQLHLKLYAAVDRDDYHTQDLVALKPTAAEIERAARWVLEQDVSAPFRESLKTMLGTLGFADVAARV